MRRFAPRIVRLTIAWAALGGSAARGGESWLVEVRETAGIERFGYPLCGEFKAPVDADGAFELQDGNQTTPAQFTRRDASENDLAPWSIDFALDLAPLETRRLRIVRAEPGDVDQQGRRGLSVEQLDATTVVRHPSLEFVVPNDLRGLFERIDVAEDDFLVAGAAGLVVSQKDGGDVPLAWSTIDGKMPLPKIVKSGPLAVVLEYNGQFALPCGESLNSQVTLEFPLGKSWVCVDWSLEQVPQSVSGIGADVRLRLAPEKKHPVLADVGANGWTYAVLKRNESLAYLAEPANVTTRHVWSVDRILGKVAKPYALPAESGAGPAPQGWAHLLDADRCTAIAVDQFAAHSRDSMRLSADGLVQLRRTFLSDGATSSPAAKRLKFWLHVVRSPAQIGAATNPQSMQTPPEVNIVPWQSAAAACE